VCPVKLQPQQLWWLAIADNEPKLRSFGLTDCIECGCCDLVCPSHIPLTSSFRQAKARIREMADEKARAARARQRFESRTERLEIEQRVRDTQLAEQKRTARSAGPKDIREMVERARHRKAPEKDAGKPDDE
jgi:electron transport complex protein RnfC